MFQHFICSLLKKSLSTGILLRIMERRMLTTVVTLHLIYLFSPFSVCPFCTSILLYQYAV